MRALVVEFADRFAESALQLAHLRGHQLRKAKQHGRGDSAAGEVLDNLAHVGRARIALGGSHDQVAFAINVKVACSPVLDAVSFDGLFDRGGQLGVSWLVSRSVSPQRQPAGWLLVAAADRIFFWSEL